MQKIKQARVENAIAINIIFFIAFFNPKSFPIAISSETILIDVILIP